MGATADRVTVNPPSDRAVNVAATAIKASSKPLIT
jgi:hypothetical protein